MKTWIKRSLVGLAAATFLLGGIAAWGHAGHRHGWQEMSAQDAAAMKARLVERVGMRLDLDAAQKARLGTLADVLRTQQLALRGGGADPRAELQGLIAGATFDRAQAQAWIDAKQRVVGSGAPAVIAAMGDFYDSLKPAQQAQVREFLARRDGRGGHRGREPHDGEGGKG